MTYEERLDRLTERHEALAQTVEIIAGLQRKNEELQYKNEELMAQVMASIARIAHPRAPYLGSGGGR